MLSIGNWSTQTGSRICLTLLIALCYHKITVNIGRSKKVIKLYEQNHSFNSKRRIEVVLRIFYVCTFFWIRAIPLNTDTHSARNNYIS